jgi:hypothetical protein
VINISVTKVKRKKNNSEMKAWQHNKLYISSRALSNKLLNQNLTNAPFSFWGVFFQHSELETTT